MDIVQKREKVLLVHTDIKEKLAIFEDLTTLGYEVLEITNSEFSDSILTSEPPVLVILDTFFPNAPGCDLCRAIRNKSTVPIIVLTNFEDLYNRVSCLEQGADDYILKPFSRAELDARIHSVLLLYRTKYNKIINNATQILIKIGDIVIDLNKKQVFSKHRRINLSKIEFTLFSFLVKNKGTALNRIIILEQVWGYKVGRIIDQRLVDVYISRLRAKLEKNSHYIHTVRGEGYMFKV
jgi:OmpR family response regulator RpaB